MIGVWRKSVCFLYLILLISCGGGSNPADDADDNNNPEPDTPAVKLTGIYTTTPSIELQPGDTYQLKVMATYEDGSEADVSNYYDLRMAPALYESNYTNYQWGVINVTETGSNITALKNGSGFSEVYYTEVDPLTGETYAFQIAVKITVGNPVPVALQGLWQYVHNGAERWLSKVLEFDYEQVDENQLKLTGSDGNTYYLLRAGIPDVQVSGQLIVFPDPASKLFTQKGITVGNISLLLQNINTEDQTSVVPNSDGSFDVTLPSTEYDLIATDNVTGENVTAQIDVSGTNVDAGEFTLTESASHNFKSSLRNTVFSNDNEYLYFGTLAGQEDIVYNKIIRVSNVGSQDVSGISFNISMPDADVKSLNVTTTLGGIAAGSYLDIPVSFSFNRPSVNKIVRINIAITDISNQTWNDHLTLSLSREKPVNVSVETLGLTGVNGYLITPGRKLLRLDWQSKFIRVPYIVGESYQIAFSTPGVASEEAYCVNVGFSQGCNAEIFNGFSQTGINEPDNNVTQARVLNLFDESLAYLSVGDIDYLSFSFDVNREPFEGINIASLITSGLASNITVQGNYAFIADSNDGVQIVDITSPSSPIIVNTIPELGTTQKVIVDNNIAYIFDYGWGLRIYDVSNPLIPVSLSQVNVNGIANGGTVVNNIAYVAKLNDGLQLVDVSDPTAPVLLGAVDTTGSASDVEVVGNIAYVADGASGLQLVDVSNPSLPVLASQNSDHGTVRYISIKNNKAYFSGFTGLYIYDVTTPASPALLGSVGGISSARDVFETQNMAFVVDNYGVYVLDISNITRPGIISKFKITSAMGLAVQNDTLLVSDLNQGLNVFNYTGGL